MGRDVNTGEVLARRMNVIIYPSTIRLLFTLPRSTPIPSLLPQYYHSCWPDSHHKSLVSETMLLAIIDKPSNDKT